MTITIGWWALPALVTAIAIAYPAKVEPDMKSVIEGIWLTSPVSLAAWLIWALWGRG